jgi:hypothetical protein
MGSPDYKVFVSPVGNIFMAEIAAALADAIETIGRDVEYCTTGLPTAEPGTINLVVAPHEYFLLLDGPNEVDIIRAAAHSITIGVEQPGTTWFEVGARYASFGPLAVDINRQGVHELQRRGIEAYRLPFGYHPGWDNWDGHDQVDRTRDVVFLGSLTTRRSEFLARSAPLLSEWRCDLRLFEVDGPVRKSSDHFVTGSRKHELLTGSRVLLNVHQGLRDYFEWVRVIEAVSNGCVVVTETSRGYAPLVPATHFLQAGVDSLAGRLDALLRDEDLRVEIAHRSYDFVRKHLSFADMIEQFLPVIERRGSMTRPPLPPGAGAWSRFERPGRRKPLPPVETVVSDQIAKMVTALDGDRQIKSMVKDLILSELSTGRAVEALTSALRYGTRDRVDVFDNSAYAHVEPHVSVVLPLFNYGRYVHQAIESVVLSEGVAAELVIVDDHSNDDSVDVVRAAMVEFDWFPIRLVTQSANRGPSPTRNVGFEHARADLVFILDADNLVYPSGLHILVSALERSEASFAYGIIEMFGEQSGLVSCLPWDLYRLAQGNYIDAMALVRKSAWEEVGGFDAESDQMGGWDDYDFWLHLAAEGHWGHLVTDFVGRYRAHNTSWQSTVNLDTAALMEFFRGKYPHLPWPEQE